MKSKITEKKFLEFFPNYTDVSKKLVELDKEFAVFAGSEIWLLVNSRVPTDLDILVGENDLIEIANAFKTKVKTKSKKGVSADYVLIENIEIVSNIKIIKDGKEIQYALTDEVYKRVNNIKVGDLSVPILAPEDTLIIKALLRRGKEEAKFDIEDIEAIKKSVKLDESYIRSRSNALNINAYTDILFRQV